MDDRETNRQVLIDRLRRAQAVAQVGSWELDLTTRVMWGSDEAFRLWGLPLSPGQILELPDVQAVPLAPYRPILDRALVDLIAGHARYDVEFEIKRPSDGAVRWIHSLAELGRRADGAGLVIGTVQDITARKTIEAALRASEERFRMFLEHAADAILIGRQGHIVELNTRACDLTGYSRAEMLGMNIRVVFPPAELERAPLRYDRLAHGEAVIAERLLARKDGSTVPVEMHTRRMPDGTDQAILRDISDRRRLEAQLQLRQRMDSIGTLASGIAHDFNNILVAIIGYAELLREEAPGLTPTGREAVEHVRTAAQRAADLVRRLRSLTRPEHHGESAFDLHDVASDVFQMLAETTERRIRKTCDVAPATWFVRGIHSDMYHALVNLGLNAVQAVEEKGVADGDEVRIAAAEYDASDADALGLASGSYVHVTVSDTGEGMSDDVKARAFDPLFSTRLKGVRKGQGLGLTMVYNIIVTQHGGAIKVDTREGRGTTIHLYLPRGLRAPATRVERVEERVQASGVILIVEDEEQIARLAGHVLSRAGYRVLVAADGEVALEQLAQHGPTIDLVILDQTLPRLSGLEVLRHISTAFPDLQVIMSSGNAIEVPPDARRAVRLLPKPYSLADLKAAVGDALREQGPRT